MVSLPTGINRLIQYIEEKDSHIYSSMHDMYRNLKLNMFSLINSEFEHSDIKNEQTLIINCKILYQTGNNIDTVKKLQDNSSISDTANQIINKCIDMTETNFQFNYDEKHTSNYINNYVRILLFKIHNFWAKYEEECKNDIDNFHIFLDKNDCSSNRGYNNVSSQVIFIAEREIREKDTKTIYNNVIQYLRDLIAKYDTNTNIFTNITLKKKNDILTNIILNNREKVDKQSLQLFCNCCDIDYIETDTRDKLLKKIHTHFS